MRVYSVESDSNDSLVLMYNVFVEKVGLKEEEKGPN